MTSPYAGRYGCTDAARERSDPLAGTAPPATGWLLIEHPAAWARDAVTSALGYDLAVAVHARARRDGMRVLMIRRPGRRPVDPQLTWYRVDLRTAVTTTATAATVDDLLTDAFDGGGVTRPGPMVLVCTHGVHDACCARFGRPVAGALAALDEINVWECSHLGGDRFAANVLTLPTGDLFGNVLPDHASQIIAAALGGAVPPELWRGRATLAMAAQAAVTALVEGGENPELDSVECSRSGDRWDVSVMVDGSSRHLQTTEGLSAPAWLTCHAPYPTRSRVWRTVQHTPGPEKHTMES